MELSIAIIQSSMVWESPSQNLENFSGKIAEITSDIDLIVLPEMFTTGFTMTPQNLDPQAGTKALEWMKKQAREKNSALVGSIPWAEDQKYTNRLFFVTPKSNTYWYDKRHTFTLAGEDKVYSAGKERLVVDYKGFRICPLICYDLRFPVWSRYKGDFDMLLYVANWPEPRVNAWDGLLKARAIENIAYCIGANRVGVDENNLAYEGHSAVYDPLGNQMVYSEKDEILYTKLNKAYLDETRDKLRFLEDRDDFNLEE